MRKLRNLIKIIIIIIILLFALIGFLVNRRQDIQNEQGDENNNIENITNLNEESQQNELYTETYDYWQTATEVTLLEEYLTIASYIENYKNILIRVNNIENDNEQEIIEILYNLTPKEYIEQYGITRENILQQPEFQGIDEEFGIKDISKVEGNIDTYYVYLYSRIDDIYIELGLTMFIDENNKTYSIIQGTPYDSSENILIKENIEKNNYNTFENVNVTDEYICNYYFNDFVKKFQTDFYYPVIYDDYLDLDYRNDNYGEYEDFEEYILNNKDEIDNLNLGSYEVRTTNNQEEYVCRASDNKNYVFKVQANGEYNVYIE